MKQLNKGYFMKNLLITLCLSFLVSAPALAGGGHSHAADGSHNQPIKEVSVDLVIKRSAQKINQLASAGKIHSSWKGVKPNNSQKKTFGHNQEWLITFNNPDIKDNSKQNLYLFYSLDGHYIAANYSGK